MMKGQRVVVFFFPKADTPGCTKEACEFRDAQKTFTKKNAVIVGISPDKDSGTCEIRGEIWPAVYPGAGSGAYDRGGLRGVEGKEHVWAEVHGDRAHAPS